MTSPIIYFRGKFFWTLTILILIASFGGCKPEKNVVRKNKKSVSNNINKALKHAEEITILDLRGEKLKSLPVDIKEFKNLEVLLLGSKLKKLFFKPRAWPYLLKIKNLPAGGFAHLEGRGVGKFYNHNYIDSLPPEIFFLNKLKILDISSIRISQQECIIIQNKIPNAIVLNSACQDTWDDYKKKHLEARKILREKYNY